MRGVASRIEMVVARIIRTCFSWSNIAKRSDSRPNGRGRTIPPPVSHTKGTIKLLFSWLVSRGMPQHRCILARQLAPRQRPIRYLLLAAGRRHQLCPFVGLSAPGSTCILSWRVLPLASSGGGCKGVRLMHPRGLRHHQLFFPNLIFQSQAVRFLLEPLQLCLVFTIATAKIHHGREGRKVERGGAEMAFSLLTKEYYHC